MKCKNWSNKLNNFVVRKLKSFKINGQQQVLSSTMPAMPKEKQTTPISLDENNFDEIKMKEQLNISNTSNTSAVSSASSVSRLLRRCNSNNLQQSQQQQCCCQLDDCCPILATSTATGSIQDHHNHYYNSTNNSNNIQNNSSTINKMNKQPQQQQQQNIQSSEHCCIIGYKSSIVCRGYKMNLSNNCNNSSSTITTSQIPTTSTTVMSSTSSSSSASSATPTGFSLCTPQLLPTTSSSSLSTTISSSTITNIKNISNNSNNSSSNCKCSKINNLNENKMQYQYYNGDSQTTTTTATTNNKNQFDKITSINNSGNNSGNISSSCSSNTTAQSSIVATASATATSSSSSAPITSNIIASSVAAATSSSSSNDGLRQMNGLSQQQEMQQQQQQKPQQQQQQLPKKTPNDFIFEQYLGEGSFSTVYHAKEVRTKKEVAIKVCEKAHIIREKKQEYVKREREVMHRMSNCPGFVNLYCTFQDESRLYFVMTYAKNGDLLPHINKVGSFDLEVTQHYAAELVLACENMHKRGIVHRDLKPENILLDENMHTLIADFGSAKIIDNNRDMYVTSSSLGTTTATTTTTSSSSPSSPSSSSLLSSTIQTPSSISSSSSSSAMLNSTTTSIAKGTTKISSTSSPINNHNINNSSSSTSNYIQSSNKYRSNNYRLYNDNENEEAQTRTRRRKCSFVGTAQYVSPELLQDGTISPACDLWALGCIIYQMISGLPPFRGNTEFLIFKQILNLNLEFPEGFDKNAEDLVRNLLKLKPEERLGAQDKIGCYESIRTHPFFDGINWDTIRIQTPPTIYPYLPGANKEDDLHSHYRVPENLEPGLNDKQLTRLLGLGLMGFEMGDKTEPKNNFNLTETEMKNRLEAQKADKWNAFADGELILKKGFVNKRKGLFARKRMLLLLTGPKLVYVDPVAMIKKGEIPWSPELRVEPKNFKIFFVHTPNRTYYLEDPDGYALKWVNAIENVRQQTYSNVPSNIKIGHH